MPTVILVGETPGALAVLPLPPVDPDVVLAVVPPEEVEAGETVVGELDLEPLLQAAITATTATRPATSITLRRTDCIKLPLEMSTPTGTPVRRV